MLWSGQWGDEMGKKYSKLWGTLAGFLVGGIVAAAAQWGFEIEQEGLMESIMGLFAMLGVYAAPANT